MRISEWSSDVCSSDLLCRAEDRIGDAGGLDQLLLGHLRPKVAALEKALRADDRESHMMPHAGGRLRREKVAAGRFEELHDGVVLEGGRVRHVNEDLGVHQGLGQPLAGDGVDPRGRAEENTYELQSLMRIAY